MELRSTLASTATLGCGEPAVKRPPRPAATIRENTVSDRPSQDSRLRCARPSPLECIESWRPLANSAHEPFVEFAAGVAHDIKNLFAVVSVTAQDLLEPVDADERAAGLRAIFDAATRGAELAAQLQ